ncbi:MAG: hypothetical protein HC915_21715 [Anaerolineae bacterium]|nr:hypothetical protein [Anaerolineae bacterium]
MHAVHTLQRLGHAVAVFHRGRTNNGLPPEVQQIRGEVSQLIDYRARFKAFRPDTVVHMLLGRTADAQQAVSIFQGIA